jgi:hypothetical protein
MILFPREYPLFQQTAGSYVKGDWVAGVETETTFQADIQPMTSKETETLSIGKRELGKVRIYTDNELTVLDTDKTGDRVVFDGYKYEVIMKDKHEVGLIPHNRFIAEKREAV